MAQTQRLPTPGGIPVLVSTASDLASQLLCNFFIKYHSGHMLATISLQVLIPVHGYSEQAFTLLYHADNLVPETTCLKTASKTASTGLSQLQVAQITRRSEPTLATLSLGLKQPCPLSRPSFLTNVVHKSGFYAPFHQLAKLAKATQIVILFDRGWIHRNIVETFEGIFVQLEKFTGFDTHDQATILADWSIFRLAQEAPLEEPPPLYVEAEAPNKRSRQISDSPLPPSKRVLRSPSPVPALSPTEKATTPSLSSPPLPTVPQQAIEAAVTKLLPSILEKTLPDLLPRLLTVSQSSPPSSSITASPKSTQPRINKPKSLGAFLRAKVAAQIESICTDMLHHANSLRSVADDEFYEVICDQKVDFHINKEDSITEVAREIDKKLVEFREIAAQVVEEAGEEVGNEVDRAYENFCARLDKLIEHTKTSMVLDLAVSNKFGKQAKELQESDTSVIRRQRAVSLP